MKDYSDTDRLDAISELGFSVTCVVDVSGLNSYWICFFGNDERVIGSTMRQAIDGALEQYSKGFSVN